MHPAMPPSDLAPLRQALLAWYDAHARALPWRVGPQAHAAGERADPYRVWLSEVMLQQTTTPHATPYFLAFTERWPTVGDLAAAEDGEVMSAWAGLGYYARARNLLACARAVAGEHGGVFPDTEAGLRALPGLGAYTAAAVAAIAYDRPAVVVDGNVERVAARLFAVQQPLPGARPELRRLAGLLASRRSAWRLGAGDHGPRRHRLPAAPAAVRPLPRGRLLPGPGGRRAGTAAAQGAKAERPRRYGAAFVALKDGRVALVRRPAKGLLGAMLALPTSAWGGAPLTLAEAAAAAPRLRPGAPSARWSTCSPTSP